MVDWSDLDLADGHLEAAIQAHADSGIRSVLAHADPRWASGDDRWRSGLKASLRQRQRIRCSPWLPVRPTRRRMIWTRWPLIGRWLGSSVSGSIPTSAPTPPPRDWSSDLAGRGLLGEDVTLVHCTHLDDADLDAIAASGARVSLTPSSEMSDGHRASPRCRG